MDFLQDSSRLDGRRDYREVDIQGSLESGVCHSFWHFTGPHNVNR